MKLILFLCLFSIFSLSFAQETEQTNKLNIQLSHSRIYVSPFISSVFSADANYKVYKNLDLGTSIGYSKYKSFPIGMFSGSPNYDDALFIKMNANYHLLPLFFEAGENLRFDLYVSAKVGGRFLFTKDDWIPVRGFYLDNGLYTGLAFYLSKHFGLYSEYGINKMKSDTYWNLKYGLTFRF